MTTTGLEAPKRRNEALHRALVYFGLADDDRPAHADPVVADDTRELVRALERRVEENTAAIEALRAEIARLRS